MRQLIERGVVAVCFGVLVAGLMGGCGDTAPAPAPAPTPVAPRPAVGGVSPVRVHYGSISADSTLVPEGLNADGTIETPDVETPEQAGWYSLGPVPGQPGPAVIMGHVNGAGRAGVFSRLVQAKAGQLVEVGRSDGSTVQFTVDRVEIVDKDDFPTAEVYSNTPDAQLRLITCGGALNRDAHSYDSNIIVFATMSGLK